MSRAGEDRLGRQARAAEAPGWLPRVGAALAAPTYALAASETSAGSGRAPADLALLILAGFMASRLARLIKAAWLMVGGTGTDGVHFLLADLSSALMAPILFVMVGGIAIGILAGHRRSLGADFDLACVAAVPLAAMPPLLELAGRLGLASTAPIAAARWASYAWSAVLLALAVRQAQRRPIRHGVGT